MSLNLQNNEVVASLKNKKIISSDFSHLLAEIPDEQRQELESLLINLKKDRDITINLDLMQSGPTSEFENKPAVIAMTIERELLKEEVRHSDPSELVFYESGVFLGIVIGCSRKKDVRKMMNYHSDCLVINENIKDYASLFFYRDIDIAFCFDENEIVKEITLGRKFKGKTSKGLKIMDNIEKAIELYGRPKSSECGIFVSYQWDNFFVFSENRMITHIRFN